MNGHPDGYAFHEGRRPDPVLPCTGACRGERAAWEGPAKFGRLPDNSRVIFCTCCMLVLTPVDAIAPPPNIAPGIDTTSKRYECRACGYDTVVLPEIRAAG